MSPLRGSVGRAPQLLAITPPVEVDDRQVAHWIACADAWSRGLASSGVHLRVLLRGAGGDWRQLLQQLQSPSSAATRFSDHCFALGVAQSFSLPPEGLRRVRDVWHRLPRGLRGVSGGLQLKGDPSVRQRTAARRIFPRRSLGASVHVAMGGSADRALDYLVVAPVYAPRTRQTGFKKEAKGLEFLRKFTRRHPAVVALGGIEVDNAGACLRAGAQGLASIRTFFGDSQEVEDNVAGLCAILQSAGGCRAGNDAVLAQARGS